jgi:putative hydrolase of HD superfamily
VNNQHASTGRAAPVVSPPQWLVGLLLELGSLSLDFGRVDRITFHQDGTTPESDTDHTVMLGLVACAFAEHALPDLDRGLIAQYAFVHDLVEVYAGDTNTLRIDDAGRADKAAREADAAKRLRGKFVWLPWLPETLTAYEQLSTPEARYVKAMDKLLPKLTHLLNGMATLKAEDVSHVELARRYQEQAGELRSYAGDFPPLLALHKELVDTLLMLRSPLTEEEARQVWAAEIGPRVEGGWYFNSYCREPYTVLGIHLADEARKRIAWSDWAITVQFPSDGRVATHCTGWRTNDDRVIVKLHASSPADLPPGTPVLHIANPPQEGVVDRFDDTEGGVWIRWQFTGLDLVRYGELEKLTVLAPRGQSGRGAHG